MSTNLENLCSGFPTEFIEFISHARSLRFEQQPDYSYLRKIFHSLANSRQITLDYQFDWTLISK